MSIASQITTAAKMMVTSPKAIGPKAIARKKMIALEVRDGLYPRPRGAFHAGVAARARGSIDR